MKWSLNRMVVLAHMMIHISLATILKHKSLVLDLKWKFQWDQVQDNTSMNKLMGQSSNALRLPTLKIKLDAKKLLLTLMADQALMITLTSLVMTQKHRSSVSDMRLKFQWGLALVNINTRTQMVLLSSATPLMTSITIQAERKLFQNQMEDPAPMITPTSLAMIQRLKNLEWDLRSRFLKVQVQVNINTNRPMELWNKDHKLGTLKIRLDAKK